MKIRSILAATALTCSFVGANPGVGAADIALPDSTVVPMCKNVGAPRSLVSEPRTFEAVAFDRDGSMLVSDLLGNRVDKVRSPGTKPERLVDVHAPGGLAPTPTGSVIVGSGLAAPSLLAPQVGVAKLFSVDPRTGAKSEYADGLSMGNGVVRAPDGTIFASNDLVPALDRISPTGVVERGWYRDTPANGLAVSRDGRTLFANVSFGDTRILAIDTRTGAARTYFRPPAGLSWVGLDDLDIDEAGRLYAAVYFAGQVWRIDPDGSFCAVAKNLLLPAGISVGPKGGGRFAASSVYVTTHTGGVQEIPHAIP